MTPLDYTIVGLALFVLYAIHRAQATRTAAALLELRGHVHTLATTLAQVAAATRGGK